MVLLTLKEGSLEVALLKRDHDPFKGVLALPGGYIRAEEDQDARDAATRVLKAKTGIVSPYLEQLASFSGPAREPRATTGATIDRSGPHASANLPHVCCADHGASNG